MITLLYVTSLFSAHSPIYSFCAGGSKCVTDMYYSVLSYILVDISITINQLSV